MVKNSCNCKNDNFSPGIGSFYLFRRYNSALTKQYENPRTTIINNMLCHHSTRAAIDFPEPPPPQYSGASIHAFQP